MLGRVRSFKRDCYRRRSKSGSPLEIDSVEQQVTALEQIASSFRTTAVAATADHARGRLLLAQGNAAMAMASLRRAVELWHELGTPYETAKARMALGETYRADGDEGAARLEFESAKAAFERLGAFRTRSVRASCWVARRVSPREPASEVRRTFVFTDIVGSTPLVEALGDDAWQELIRWHDQTLRSIFSRYGGTEVKQTGDGFFVAFEDASAAIDAGVAVQRSLAEHRRDHGFAPQVRIGLHEAEAATRAIDFAGRGVHGQLELAALPLPGRSLPALTPCAAQRRAMQSPSRVRSLLRASPSRSTW